MKTQKEKKTTNEKQKFQIWNAEFNKGEQEK